MDHRRKRVSDDIFACLCDGRLVFLDLPRNRYSCLPIRYSLAAAQLLGLSCPGPDTENPNQSELTDVELAHLTRRLGERGIFVDADRPASSTLHHHPTQPVINAATIQLQGKAQVSPRYWLTFYMAAIKTTIRLRYWSMRKIVYGIAARRAATPKLTMSASLHDLIGAFNGLRPFYARRYRCLFDSLCLLEFLACHGHFPYLVFGVKAEPFSAHCWVQEGDCVLNDRVDFVRAFTLILAA